jgi:hypothetical protein
MAFPSPAVAYVNHVRGDTCSPMQCALAHIIGSTASSNLKEVVYANAVYNSITPLFLGLFFKVEISTPDSSKTFYCRWGVVHPIPAPTGIDIGRLSYDNTYCYEAIRARHVIPNSQELC